MRVLLINPNTNTSTTQMMVSVARSHGEPHWQWSHMTADQGSALIDRPESLAVAAQEVMGMHEAIAKSQVDAVIVAAFGDPGMQALRARLPIPVFGIGECAMQAAHRLEQAFSVLTITPLLRESTLSQIQRYGCTTFFNSLVITDAQAQHSAQSTESLIESIGHSIRKAIDIDGSRTLVIGGGPVAAAAAQISATLAEPVTMIQPLVEAVRCVRSLSTARFPSVALR
ncbi:hypothetical protein E9531_16970 [Lampropedia puyangensis]|uniref:Aspartate/glutamate racemase family protein n=1 Tax=Lampropedia puyangensis TaxID=1330072 RepID=A0A4S8EMN7_9BURK|nr:aspartate/glutamate racemase family protein [Lampropedia puyangensis]THT95957.1 hypothetical protein E9531_16970 [Lampropedia puyangensis]